MSTQKDIVLEAMFALQEKGQNIFTVGQIEGQLAGALPTKAVVTGLQQLRTARKIRYLMKGVYDHPSHTGRDIGALPMADREELALCVATRRGLNRIFPASQTIAHQLGFPVRPADEGTFRWESENRRVTKVHDGGPDLRLEVLANWLHVFIDNPAYDLLSALSFLRTNSTNAQYTLDVLAGLWTEEFDEAVAPRMSHLPRFIRDMIRQATEVADVPRAKECVLNKVVQQIRADLKANPNKKFFPKRTYILAAGEHFVNNAADHLCEMGEIRMVDRVIAHADYVYSDEDLPELIKAIAEDTATHVYPGYEQIAVERGVLSPDEVRGSLSYRWTRYQRTIAVGGRTTVIEPINKPLLRYLDTPLYEPLALFYLLHRRDMLDEKMLAKLQFGGVVTSKEWALLNKEGDLLPRFMTEILATYETQARRIAS